MTMVEVIGVQKKQNFQFMPHATRLVLKDSCFAYTDGSVMLMQDF